MKNRFLLLFLFISCQLPAAVFSQFEPGPNDWVDLDKVPQILNMDDFILAVGYPDSAKKNDITGKVVLRVQIDTLGNVINHVVLKDPHPWLTHAAVNGLPVLRFSPGVYQGRKVKVWATIPLDFKLTPPPYQGKSRKKR